jgi:hypothetical protein
MERQLMSTRRLIFWLSVIALVLWYYWPFLFPKQLDNTDIIWLEKSYTGQEKHLGGGIWSHRNYYICIGVKNISKDRPSQYKDFLPKVAAQIADTTREEIQIYFLTYDTQIEYYTYIMSPYKLEELKPSSFILMQYWNKKKPTFTQWYIPQLKHLNTEVSDILHLDDVQIEQVK